MSRPKSRLLYRTIATHLVVAVAPALALGAIVIGVNREALTLDAEQLHLSVAAQMQTQLSQTFDATRIVLEQAERTLDTTSIPVESRQTLLRALVANQRIPYLAIYDEAGHFDSVVATDEADVDRRPLHATLLERLAEGGAVVGDVAEDRTVRVVIRWARGDEVFGYLGTRFSVARVDALATELAARHLETSDGTDEGEVSIVDETGRYIASSEPTRIDETAGEQSPFGKIEGWGSPEGFTSIATGRSMRFEDRRGDVRLGTILSVPELRWVIGTSRPERVALASIASVRRRTLALALVAALAGGLMGLLLARQLSEPVRRLAQSVRASARRGFFEPVVASGYREVESLAGAFNEALGELSRHRDEERMTTQLRLRLSRYLPPSALHEIFTTELAAGRGERTSVSVLYADLSGAEPLVNVVDKAHLIAILSDFFAAACASVERSGGQIDRYSGDAVIGVFLTEDPSARAAAALAAARAVINDADAIAERFGAPFSASVGLVSGEGLLMASLEATKEVSVGGDLVERAAALEASEGGRSSGVVVMDASTHAALGDNLPGPVTVRGETQQVFVLNVRGVSGMEGGGA